MVKAYINSSITKRIRWIIKNIKTILARDQNIKRWTSNYKMLSMYNHCGHHLFLFQNYRRYI